MKPEEVPPAVVLREGSRPLVRYMCAACDRVVMWIHEDKPGGRPIWGDEVRNVTTGRLWPGGPGSGRRFRGYLDEPSFSAREFGCGRKSHGSFNISRVEMLDHFHQARANKPVVIIIDEASPWFGPLS